MVPSAPATGGVVSLRVGADNASVGSALAAAVDNADLRLLYAAADGTWIDVDGVRHDPAAPSGARTATTVDIGGAVVALIEHDAAVGADVLQAACSALTNRLATEREIAELRARARGLEGSEQRLREVFEAVGLMVVAMDLDARMTYVN